MSDERIPQSQPQDELSDEQLEQVSGGDGNREQPTLTAASNGETKSPSGHRDEIHIESYSWGMSQTG
jgi:bacteriocin-like protein